MNTQPIEKLVRGNIDLLSVHSIFLTIQGEGPFCGTPCVFIRLAGCNLQCPSCDTDYTQGRETFSVAQLVRRAQEFRCGANLVVITGGEPFRQDVAALIAGLISAGFYVQIETNGTLPPPVGIDFQKNFDLRSGAYIVCSPKTPKINPRMLRAASCLKYVVAHDNVAIDGLPLKVLGHAAKPYVARPPEDWKLPIYLQPMDSKDEKENDLNLKAAIMSCLVNGYILQLQIHKIIGME